MARSTPDTHGQAVPVTGDLKASVELQRIVSIAKITPPKCLGLLARDRLYRQLDASGRFPVTWVSAQAGSGKTTLVAAYLAESKTPCIWYRVDRGDADIATFFYYMGLAAKRVATRHRTPLPLLTQEYMLGIETFAIRYFESLYGCLQAPFVIVLDNYQLVPVQSEFHEVIREGLGILPEQIRVIIVSREPPPPPFGLLRARERIGFLEERDIRFTYEETAKMVCLKGVGKLSETLLAELHARTRGWAAGLVLMSECLKRTGEDAQAFRELASEGAFDYFATEIIRKTDRKTHDFLLKTALLPNMTIAATEKLTGIEGAAEILNHLSRNNYFTQKHHHAEPAYRYHPLFRDFLRSRLNASYGEEELLSLKRRAAAILGDSGEIEEAAELLRETGQWGDLAQLVLSQAQSLSQQGRIHTLEELLAGIPPEHMEHAPWLSYWKGACRLLQAPSQARSLFERAFHLFCSQQDETGALLAWSGIVDSILLEADDFTLFDRWIDWLMDRANLDSLSSSAEIEMLVVSNLARALLFRRSEPSGLERWMERALALSFGNAAAPLGSRLHVQITAQLYYSYCGDPAKCKSLAEQSALMAGKENAPPMAKIMQKVIEGNGSGLFRSTCGQALQAVCDGLDLADKTGVHLYDIMLIAFGSYACLSLKDHEKGLWLIRKLEKAAEYRGMFSRSLSTFLSGWHYLLAGDVSLAARYAAQSLNLAVTVGIPFPQMLIRLLTAEILAERGENGRAKEELEVLSQIAQKTGSWLMEYYHLLCRAHIELEGGQRKEAAELLKHAFAMGRVHDFKDLYFWWRPEKMARLCMKVLEEGIEKEFVQSLVRELELVPEKAPIEIESWPWPLRIHTLGRFELKRDNVPVECRGKKKQIELLKGLVSLGGRAVRVEQCIDCLWPDSEGDYGYSSFKMSLSRLRRILPEEAIVFQDGLLTLHHNRVWTDVRMFERQAERAFILWEELRKNGGKDPGAKPLAEEALSLTDKAMALYRGPFLDGDTSLVWAVPMRERLRSKFLRLAGAAADHLECKARWKSAVLLYLKALEAEALHEEFYQRLMVCHRALGNQAAALSVYERCRAQLAAAVGLAPSPATEALRATLRP